jgi:hypothetical protein
MTLLILAGSPSGLYRALLVIEAGQTHTLKDDGRSMVHE